MEKREKGIALITLAVIILVLIILASVTLGSISDRDGIINEAQQNGQEAQKQSIIEKIQADLYNEKVKNGKEPDKEKLIGIINEKYGTVEGDTFTSKEGNYTISLKEIRGWERKYAQQGLVLHLDAINNVGGGDDEHSSTTTVWKDLSGNGNDGILQGFEDNSWSSDYLTFDGVNDWVKLGEMNYENVTIEVVMEYITHKTNAEADIVSNFESGGYGIFNGNANGSSNKARNTFWINLDKVYYQAEATVDIQNGKKYSLIGNYDGEKISFWENGQKTQITQKGKIRNPLNNTIMILGANPLRDRADFAFLNGKIYSVRIYNRALSDEEVMNNYEIDQERFGV